MPGPKQPGARGRPTKPATPGKRASLGLKVTPEIKTLLDGAAKQNGRTQSQEAELRIEQSFRDDRIERRLARIELALQVRSAG